MAESVKGPNISNNDQLRFMEAILNDDFKSLNRSSHDCLERCGFDSHKSIMRVIDFYDKITEVFNGPSFIPQIQALPDLHNDFIVSKKLPLQYYKLTRDKAKDVTTTIQPTLLTLINKYGLNGTGTGHMNEEEEE